MADVYYFNEFQDYIKTLCIKHKDILHVDGSKRAFFRFMTDEDLQSLPNKAAKVMVGIGDFEGRAIGEVDERKIQQVATLLFLVNVGNTAGSPAGAIEAALKKAFDILMDFYTRFLYDLEQDDCGPLKYLEADKMTFFPVDGPVLENYYGWELTIPFKVNAPAYNPANWNA